MLTNNVSNVCFSDDFFFFHSASRICTWEQVLTLSLGLALMELLYVTGENHSNTCNCPAGIPYLILRPSLPRSDQTDRQMPVRSGCEGDQNQERELEQIHAHLILSPGKWLQHFLYIKSCPTTLRRPRSYCNEGSKNGMNKIVIKFKIFICD